MYDPSFYNPAGRFTGLSLLYKSGRPSYPQAAIQYILQECDLTSGKVLADIGCGTGISTRLFAEQQLHVIGVDPNQDMLTEARNTPHEDSSLISYLIGTAESTSVEDSFCDAVLCAQAFHWFHKEKALAEFHRILKPQGKVVLMWNERREDDRFTAEYGDIMRAFADATLVEVQRGEAGNALFQTEVFSEAAVKTFTNEQVLDSAGLIARAFSTSYAPGQRTVNGARLTEALNELFGRMNEDGVVIMRYTCSVYTACKCKEQ